MGSQSGTWGFWVGEDFDSEEDAARSLVQLLDFGTKMETFRVDSEYYVVKFNVPEKFVGYFVNELEFRWRIQFEVDRIEAFQYDQEIAWAFLWWSTRL